MLREWLHRREDADEAALLLEGVHRDQATACLPDGGREARLRIRVLEVGGGEQVGEFGD
jgi:hypothetical protein